MGRVWGQSGVVVVGSGSSSRILYTDFIWLGGNSLDPVVICFGKLLIWYGSYSHLLVYNVIVSFCVEGLY